MRPATVCLITFALGAGLRAIPELEAPSFLVGHDTVFYAGKIARATSCLDWSYFGHSPLLFMMLCPLGRLVGPVATMKFAPVILYGVLAASLSWFITKSIKISSLNSTLVSVFVMVQVATLRMGWDLHRSVFATSLLFLLLANLESNGDWVHALLSGFLSALVVASNELVGTFMVLISTVILGLKVLRGDMNAVKLLLPSLVVGSAAVVWFFMTATVYEPLLINYGGRFASVVTSQSHFFTLLFLPLLPFAVLSNKANRTLLAWAGLVGLISFSPLAPLPLAPAFWDRWMLMLVFPLGTLAGLGIIRIHAFTRRRLACTRWPKVMRFWMTVALMATMVFPFVALATGFMAAPSEHPFIVFKDPILWRAGWSGIPATMLSNSVDFRMISDIQRSLAWLDHRMNSSDVLLVHDAFYGYALIYLPDTENLLWYGYYGLDWGISKARAQGFKEAYLIWFTPGSDWHSPDPDLSEFRSVYQSGMIRVYFTQFS